MSHQRLLSSENTLIASTLPFPVIHHNTYFLNTCPFVCIATVSVHLKEALFRLPPLFSFSVSFIMNDREYDRIGFLFLL